MERTRGAKRATATTLTVEGRTFLSFAGTGYLGLAHHPEVVEAAREALSTCGLSAGASRETSGSFVQHEQLEEGLARFLGVEAALVTPSGWLANGALLASPPEPRLAFVDAEAHPSLTASAGQGGAEVMTYEATDLAPVRQRLSDAVGEAVALCTDGLFPMAQRVADVPGLLELLPGDGLLVLDDSHGIGVLGEGGRGTARQLGVTDARVAITGSLAKALGAAGGLVAGSAALVERVRAGGDSYAGTTPIPPAVAAGACAALGVLEREPARHGRLLENARRLGELGVRLGRARHPLPIPVLAVPVPDEDRGRGLQAALEDAGLFVPWTRYGGGGGDLRIAVTSEHGAEEIERLAAVLEAELRRR